MLRISAFIAVLTLTGTVTTGAWAAQGAYARGAYQAGCYNSQRCASFCNQHGGINCKQVCQRRASTMPHCSGVDLTFATTWPQFATRM